MSKSIFSLKSTAIALMLIIIGTNLTGCIGVNTEFRKIRNHIFDKMDLDYNKQFEFAVGPAGLLLVGMFVSLADTDEPIDEVLRRVSRVQVGVYDRNKINLFHADYSDLKSFTDVMSENGWVYIVRSVQPDGLTAVFVRGDADEEFNQLFVIAVEDDEMVLVEIHGDLEKIIEIAIREKGLHFETAHGD